MAAEARRVPGRLGGCLILALPLLAAAVAERREGGSADREGLVAGPAAVPTTPPSLAGYLRASGAAPQATGANCRRGLPPSQTATSEPLPSGAGSPTPVANTVFPAGRSAACGGSGSGTREALDTARQLRAARRASERARGQAPLTRVQPVLGEERGAGSQEPLQGSARSVPEGGHNDGSGRSSLDYRDTPSVATQDPPVAGVAATAGAEGHSRGALARAEGRHHDCAGWESRLCLSESTEVLSGPGSSEAARDGMTA